MKYFNLLVLLLMFSCAKEEPTLDPVKYTLTVTAGEGGNVSSTGGSYPLGSEVTITATPNSEYVFSGWSNGSTDNPIKLTINSNQTLTANFTKRKYALSITIEGEGTVTEEVISSGKDYDSGTVVRLTAVPSENWRFEEWKGDVTSTQNTIDITVDKATTISIVFELNNFSLVENAFPDLSTIYQSLGGGVNSTVTAKADLNNDGYQDLVIHLWKQIQYRVTEEKVNNRLLTFLNNGDNTFRIGNQELFGSEIIEFDGITRKVDSNDINCDNFPDFIFAVNKEDGRDGSDGRWNAINAAMISNGIGGYEIVKIDPLNPNYTHSVEIIKDGECNFVVVFDGEQDYRVSGSTFMKLNNTYIDDPNYINRAIGTFLAYDENNDGIDDVIIHDTMDDPYWLTPFLTIYKRTSNWNKVGEYRWENTFRIVEGDGNGNYFPNNAVVDNGNTYLSGGFFASDVVRGENETPIPFIRFGTTKLNTNDQVKESDTIYTNIDRIAYSRLLALNVTSNSVNEHFVFDNERIEGNINFSDVVDFDNDGFQDIVLYPYYTQGMPILLKNSQNMFVDTQLGDYLPDASNLNFDTSILMDVNNDGLLDIIYRTAHGCYEDNCNKMRLYIANRGLSESYN